MVKEPSFYSFLWDAAHIRVKQLTPSEGWVEVTHWTFPQDYHIRKLACWALLDEAIEIGGRIDATQKLVGLVRNEEDGSMELAYETGQHALGDQSHVVFVGYFPSEESARKHIHRTAKTAYTLQCDDGCVENHAAPVGVS